MQTGTISFCDNIGFNVKSDEFKKKILQELDENYNFRIIQKHHERFNPSMIPNLTNNPHLICPRTNGNPYMLYLTKFNFTNQCIFIDKKIQQGYFYPRMIIVKLWFDEPLFSGTLLDGEMIKTKSDEWHYVIHDIISYYKQNLYESNVVRRINILYDILSNKYIEDDFSCCKLKIKKYFTYDQFDYMLNTFIPSLPYSCHGIYFKPLYLKFRDILFNFDETLVKSVVKIKYKNNYEVRDRNINNTIPEKIVVATPSILHEDYKVLYLQKTNQPDIYDLYEVKDGKTSIDIALVNDIATSKRLRHDFKDNLPKDMIAYKCQYSSKFGKWIPKEMSRLNKLE